MHLKKYLVIILSLIPQFAAAQNEVLEQLRSHPAYEVTLNADSTVEIYNKHQNYRYLKTIRQMPEYENTTQANLIIELDTVNFAAYESLYRRWGSIPGINEAGKYISIDANGNEHREIFIYHAYFDNQSGYPAVRIYEHDLDSIFNFVYEFPNDSLNFIYDVGDVLSDGFLDVFIRNNENKIFSFKQQTITSYTG